MKTIEKPWGQEELLEHNEKYVLKRLFMKKGHKCSYQYHEHKKETVYLLSGLLKIHLEVDGERTEKVLKPNESLTIPPFQKHRMEGIEESIYLEASTPELEDVVRIQDDYGR